jgi:uncharacterized protein YqjF (DUF2071 family)
VDGPGRVFLIAEWRYLAMLNYAVDPALLVPRVPRGTELDEFGGKTFVSLVGFRFLSTRVFGIPIPFHRNFDEVNLRFYVKRRESGVVKRGVVFIQELVPRRAIAAVARLAYHENYRALPMTHQIEESGTGLSVQYAWRHEERANNMRVFATGSPRAMVEGSEEQFIAEHYWGYCRQPDGGTLEYHVDHPPWRVWQVAQAQFSGDAGALYGAEFGAVPTRPPDSAFLAEGSPVKVHVGRRLDLL